jgi:hypothetical protein
MLHFPSGYVILQACTQPMKVEDELFLVLWLFENGVMTISMNFVHPSHTKPKTFSINKCYHIYLSIDYKFANDLENEANNVNMICQNSLQLHSINATSFTNIVLNKFSYQYVLDVELGTYNRSLLTKYISISSDQVYFSLSNLRTYIYFPFYKSTSYGSQSSHIHLQNHLYNDRKNLHWSIHQSTM